ncbi:hypothetical protein JCM11251_006675 [Rhodosporidiobolus azoricus]
MDRSYSSTVLHTPSPLDRRSSPLSSSTLLNKAQLAASIAPSSSSSTTTVQPLSFNPANSPVRHTTSSILPGPVAKNVRFSPAHSSVASHGGFTSQYSSAPPSRIQSFATPPRSYSSPSLLRTAQQNHGLASGGQGTATPPRQDQQQGQPQQQQQQQQQGQGQGQGQQAVRQSPTVQAKQLLHAGEAKVQSALAGSGAAVQEVKKKLDAVPLGRGEAARRLRVNAVLLVAWWVSSRTVAYRFAAGHLVAAAPQLDTPLHICETLLLLLLCYNIIDSLRALNSLSSLSSPSTIRPGPLATFTSPARPGPSRGTPSTSLGSPARSSPKTRPSPSALSHGSPSSSNSPTTARLRTTSSPFRASALSSPNPPTPQTPTSALRSNGASSSSSDSSTNTAAAASSALRRSLNGGGASPSVYTTPLGLKSPGSVVDQGTAAAVTDEAGSAFLAYEARRGESPAAAGGRQVVVDSQEAIERLFQ